MKSFRSNNLSIIFLIFTFLVPSWAMATGDPMSPMYKKGLPEPQADLSATPLAGKFVRYGYHTFWEVNKDKGTKGAPSSMLLGVEVLFYENNECEWFALRDGHGVRSPCATIEVAPNVYMVSWIESESEQVVTLILNLNTWTINHSFHFNSGKGLALFEGGIYSFGDYPVPPVTQKP